MKRPSRLTEVVVWGLLALTVLAIVAAFILERLRLPGRGREAEAAPGRPAAGTPAWPPLFRVPPFSLTNQTGGLFSSTELAGQVWVADVFFTACAGPCPRMTAWMAEVQAAMDVASPVRFVSITTDPERDTPEVLARYAQRAGADPQRWHFLTGSKAQIRAAAVDGLKFTAEEKDPAARESPADLFIHSTLFVVVDKQGWVRATFELDTPGAKEGVLAALQALVQEKP
jgi:protein SCO1/2